jgi:hypothetical protein
VGEIGSVCKVEQQISVERQWLSGPACHHK